MGLDSGFKGLKIAFLIIYSFNKYLHHFLHIFFYHSRNPITLTEFFILFFSIPHVAAYMKMADRLKYSEKLLTFTIQIYVFLVHDKFSALVMV